MSTQIGCLWLVRQRLNLIEQPRLFGLFWIEFVFTFLPLLVLLFPALAGAGMPDRDGTGGPVLEPGQEVVVASQETPERGRAAESVDRDSVRAQR